MEDKRHEMEKNGCVLGEIGRVQAMNFHVVNLSHHFFHVVGSVNVSSVTDLPRGRRVSHPLSTWQEQEGELVSASSHYSVDAYIML